MACSPTSRSLERCRKREWPAQVVEQWNQHSGTRKDLFGCIDLVALDGNPGVLGIQACSDGDLMTRARKAQEQPHLRDWLLAGNRFEVWGWKKRPHKRKDGTKSDVERWACRVYRITLAVNPQQTADLETW